jgi:hypothetical protein
MEPVCEMGALAEYQLCSREKVTVSRTPAMIDPGQSARVGTVERNDVWHASIAGGADIRPPDMTEMAVENACGGFACNTHSVVEMLPETQTAECLVSKTPRGRLLLQRSQVRDRIGFNIQETFAHNVARHSIRQRKNLAVQPVLGQFEPVDCVMKDCESEVTHVNDF